MIAAPVGIPVIQTFQMSIVLSLLLSALANSGDCQTAGTTCAVEDAVPARGEALLQLPTLLKNTAQREEAPATRAFPNHQQRSVKSMMQAEAHRGDVLPDEAKILFNEKLCMSQPAMLLAKTNALETKSSTKKSYQGNGDQQLQPVDSGFSKSFLEDFTLDSAAEHEHMQSFSASLDQAGFAKIRDLSNKEEMALFIRRVAHSCNMLVIDEGGLNGAVDWFKKAGAGATFEDLKVALFKSLLAASSDHWVTVKHAGISAESAPLDLVGFVQVRALRKPKETIQFVKRMVAQLGIKIKDMDGFNGLMAYYSEPDDSESFWKLLEEIHKAAHDRSWAEME